MNHSRPPPIISRLAVVVIWMVIQLVLWILPSPLAQSAVRLFGFLGVFRTPNPSVVDFVTSVITGNTNLISVNYKALVLTLTLSFVATWITLVCLAAMCTGRKLRILFWRNFGPNWSRPCCPQCGYILLSESVGCPECGWKRA